MTADSELTTEQSDSYVCVECSSCGDEIRLCTSAYDSWDEVITVEWTPASDDTAHVDDLGSAGRHPQIQRDSFCSTDCLQAFAGVDR